MEDDIKDDPVTEWMANNPHEIFKHAGQYIAISGFKVIAFGTTSVEVMNKVVKIDPTIRPLIMKVPPDGLSI